MSDLLLAVPNVSEGRDAEAIEAIGAAFASTGALLLDVHSDPDHHRSVFTLAAPAGELAPALEAGAREAVARVDLERERGAHPHVGALDVAPVVHLDDERRGPACAEALVAAHLIGGLGVPVLLYGALAGGRARADLRRGGPQQLTSRLECGELRSDFGPHRAQPSSGVTLVSARPPLVAFNVELEPPATIDDARAIATAIREGGEEGLPGVRAIGLELPARGGVAQVSLNIEDPRSAPLATVVAAIARHRPVAEAELVGLAPEAAFEGFPEDLFVRNLRTVEEALARLS